MNRRELLQEFYNSVSHNIFCYSEDYSMSKPKKEYEEDWHIEQEKLEIIREMIEEENAKDFQLYTSIYNLRNDREERINFDLAYLEDRENGISCFLTLREKEEGEIPEYDLVFNIHKKEDFDYEYENIYSRETKKEAFKNRETLKKEMQDGLECFKKLIEADKSKDRLFAKYYENEETEEFE